MVGDEHPHLLGVEVQALPVAAVAQRLVLRGDPPHRDPLRLIRLQVAHDVGREGRVVLGLQLAAVPPVVVLHPRRRRPRRGQHLEARALHLLRVLDHGQQVVAVRLDGEVLEGHVIGDRRVAVVLDREVAACDVRPRQGVVRALRREVRPQHLVALLRGELGEHLTAGLGE